MPWTLLTRPDGLKRLVNLDSYARIEPSPLRQDDGKTALLGGSDRVLVEEPFELFVQLLVGQPVAQAAEFRQALAALWEASCADRELDDLRDEETTLGLKGDDKARFEVLKNVKHFLDDESDDNEVAVS